MKLFSYGFRMNSIFVALVASNAMQLRTLILQKQHDTIWIVSLLLVCLSIILNFAFGVLLFLLAKGDIRNSRQQLKLQRLNCLSLILAMTIGVINVVLNGLMMSTNPKAFLDRTTIERLENQPPT